MPGENKLTVILTLGEVELQATIPLDPVVERVKKRVTARRPKPAAAKQIPQATEKRT